MRVERIQNNNLNFCNNKFKLSEETLNSISRTTKLSREELSLPFDEAEKLMKQRGAFKEPSKFNLWLMKKYKEFGERFGLIEKQYNFYTHAD